MFPPPDSHSLENSSDGYPESSYPQGGGSKASPNGTATADDHRGHELVPYSGGMMSASGFPWAVGPTRPEILTATPTFGNLMHALRRRLWLAIFGGLVLGGALGYSAWKLMPTKFESAATLQVKIQDPHVLYHGEGVEFEAYKRNLVAAIKTSSLVIQKVLDSKAVQNVPVIKEHGLDAGAWLSDNLTVDDQLGSEYVKVALRYEDPHGLPDIVNALVNAYMSGVLDTERTDKLRRRDELDKKYRTYKQNVLDKERQLFELNQQIGTADAETAKIKYRIEVADLEGLMQSRAEAQKQIAELTMKIEMAKQMYADAQKGDVSDAQIEELIARDPQILQANNDLALLHRQERELSKVVKNSARSPEMVRIRDTISSVEQSIEEFRTADRQRLIESIRRNGAEGGANMKALELERQLYVDQFKHSTQDVATQAENVQKLEKFNGDADQLRTDITQLQTVVNEMSNTLTQWNIELDAPPRVTLQSEASAVRAVDPYKQYGMAGFGGFLGFGLALAAATFYEFFSRRVNSANDVAEGLGIRVMGDLPALRRRRIALRARSRRAIHGLVAESINSIRAALVRNSEPGACNVYLVSSAVDQEGKTTVASQLAASLARSGRRTLLLDGDLRHPGAHHVFGLTNEYGFSEMLRGEVHVDDAIRPTPADNLWMITAGQACAQAVLMLGKDALGEIFSRLEARFDFIVVDSGPVLKVADPMLLGQFVDGAILSTLRDVSQIHKVYEASERLKLAGVKVVGAVVNGVDEHSAYDRYNVELPAA